MAAALKSVPCVTVSARLNTSAPLLAIVLLGESEPAVAPLPPLPTWSVPPLIVVPPV